MSTFTKYKKMEKPIAIERYSIDIVNKNSDIIDSELHKLELKNESQDTLLATKEALNAEISRAVAKENNIESSLNSEISRAQSAEYQISRDLENEIKRATQAETKINTKQQDALDSALSTHNTSDSSHSDMRTLISNLTARLSALADSDDTTLDQLSEIVAYIKNNKDLIDGVTTSKVNVSDIIDDLTSSVADRPLSASQGKILKELIDVEKNKLNGIVTGAVSAGSAANAVSADKIDGYHLYVLSESAYQALASNNEIDPDTIYYRYRQE